MGLVFGGLILTKRLPVSLTQVAEFSQTIHLVCENGYRVPTWSFGNQETIFDSPKWIKGTDLSLPKKSVRGFGTREERASAKTKAPSTRLVFQRDSISIQIIILYYNMVRQVLLYRYITLHKHFKKMENQKLKISFMTIKRHLPHNAK